MLLVGILNYLFTYFREQHANLWISCGSLGVLLLFRRYNLDVCLSG